MNSFIFSIVTCLAILNGCFSLSFRCSERAGWKESIDKMFKKQCKQFQQLPNSCNGAHLAHVASWYDICVAAENFFNRGDFVSMQRLVAALFLIDTGAQVWIKAGNQKSALSHQTYMGNVILQKNTEFENATKKIVDNWKAGKDRDDTTVNNFRLLVNSAPANLRYGDPNINSGIGKYLDPMGDINQKMTCKEKKWEKGLRKDFKCKLPTVITVCAKCNCTNACKTSSTTADSINFYVCKK